MSASARSSPWGWMLLTWTLENPLQKPENRARGNSAWNEGLVSWCAASRLPGTSAKKACVAATGSPAADAGTSGAGVPAVPVADPAVSPAASVFDVSEAGADDDVGAEDVGSEEVGDEDEDDEDGVSSAWLP